MKKLIPLFLVVAMIFAVMIPSFADGTTSTETSDVETTIEETTAEDTTVEDTTVEDTTAEETTAEETTVEDTTVEDTTVEDTTVEDTTVEDTTTEESTTEEPTTEEPTTEEPTTEEPTTEEPTTEEPTTEEPTTEEPTTEEPTTEEPTTEEPTTEPDEDEPSFLKSVWQSFLDSIRNSLPSFRNIFDNIFGFFATLFKNVDVPDEPTTDPSDTENTALVAINIVDADGTVLSTVDYNVPAGTELTQDYITGLLVADGYDFAGTISGDALNDAAVAGKIYSFEARL